MSTRTSLFYICMFIYQMPSEALAQEATCGTTYQYASPQYLKIYKKHPHSGRPSPEDYGTYGQAPAPAYQFEFAAARPKKYMRFLLDVHIIPDSLSADFEAQIQAAVTNANRLFLAARIQFQVQKIFRYQKTIPTVEMYNQSKSAFLFQNELLTKYGWNYNPKHINLYLVDHLKLDGQHAFGVSMFPHDELNLLLIETHKINDKLTLAHELGHFFGLFHTYETFGDKAIIGDDGLITTPRDPYHLFDINDLLDACKGVIEKDGIIYHPPIDNIMSGYNVCMNTPKKFVPEQLNYMRYIAVTERKDLKIMYSELPENIYQIEWKWETHIRSIDELLEIGANPNHKNQVFILILDEEVTWSDCFLNELEENQTLVDLIQSKWISVSLRPHFMTKRQQKEVLGNIRFRNGHESTKINFYEKYLDPHFASYPMIILLQLENNGVIKETIIRGYRNSNKLLKSMQALSIENQRISNN